MRYRIPERWREEPADGVIAFIGDGFDWPLFRGVFAAHLTDRALRRGRAQQTGYVLVMPPGPLRRA